MPSAGATAGQTASEGGEAAGGASAIEAEAALSATAGNVISGRAHFSQLEEVVSLQLTLQGCPAGTHALHLHENADCRDDANAAGGHWSPRGEVIEDITCGADGVAELLFVAAPGSWSIGAPASSDLLLHALVLHEGPSVAPGGRIACGIAAKLP
jgi:superoxide dismutase, Cu-Zn family